MSKTYTEQRVINKAKACNGAAARHYTELLNSIEERVVELNKVLTNHAKQDGLNWAHGGDLARIDEVLAELLSCFSDSLKV